MECIFCKIIDGVIPTKKLYETENSLAFLDAFPLVRGHTLVIPKNHYSKIQEMNKDDNHDLFDTVQIMTAKLESISSSCLVAIHNGKESGQEVPHVHIHLIPRKISDGAGPVHNMFAKKLSLSSDEMNNIYDVITGIK